MKNKISIFNLLFAFLFLVFFSCDKQEKELDKSQSNEYVMMLKVGDSSYLGSFADLDVKNVDTSNSFEHVPGGEPYFYENFVFYAEGVVGNKIFKYELSETGDLIPKGHLIMPSASMPAEMCFYSKDKAYVSLNGLGKIAIINPTKMTIDGEIDLREYAVGDNNPDPGVSIIRDGKLFVCLNQKKSQMNAYQKAYVAIIDVATDKVEKVIVDDRVSSIGMFSHSSAIIDEDSNIYFYGNGMCGFQKDAKEGFLRIKNGETEWDKDFYCSIKELNIPGVAGNKGSYTLCLEYGGDGDVYMNVQIPALGTNPPDFINTRDYQPCKLNLFKKTIDLIDLPATAGWAAWGISKNANKLVFALSTKSNNGLYVYDKETGECSKEAVVSTAGIPSYIQYIGK